MKQYLNVLANHHIAFIILLLLSTLSLFIPISLSAANKTDAGNELISLTVKDEPLGEVLKKISMATGYQITFDNKWQSYIVNVSLEEVSLHKGLKRILKNLNNVIIFNSDKKINIILYDKTESEGVSSVSSTDKLFNATMFSQRRSPNLQGIEMTDMLLHRTPPQDQPSIPEYEDRPPLPQDEDRPPLPEDEDRPPLPQDSQ